jgi:hypothetical protein
MKSIRVGWRRDEADWILKSPYSAEILGRARKIGSAWSGSLASGAALNVPCPSCSSAERQVEHALGVKEQTDWQVEDCGGGCPGENVGTCILGDREFTNEEREAWPTIPRWCPLRKRPILMRLARGV